MQAIGDSFSSGSGSALVGAAEWIAALLTGSVAIAVAMLAIAALGVLMLTGRVPARQAGQIIVGCFILFSAHAISSQFAGLGREPAAVPVDAPPQATAYQPVVPVLEQKDPFGGAAAPPPQQDDL